jgi:hypothetical protein
MHKDLDVWKLGIELVEKIYKITSQFPKFEHFGLSFQMQRAAVSVPSNIAEGAAINSEKEYIHDIFIIEEVEKLRRKLLKFIKYFKEKTRKRFYAFSL